MLLTIEEIQQKLDEKFVPLEPKLTGLRLLDYDEGDSVVTQIEAEFGFQLDANFASLVSRFDFGWHSIGPFQFCYGGDFVAELITYNVPNELNMLSGFWWFGTPERPESMLLIAVADPYNILLDNSTGEIRTFPHYELCQNSTVVSTDLEHFIRGMGTLSLLRNREGSNEEVLGNVLTQIGGEFNIEFWEWMAEWFCRQ